MAFPCFIYDLRWTTITKFYRLVGAGINGITGHDLRRSFATLVATTSNNEFIAMRLIRDKIPGLNERYIKFQCLDCGKL